MTQQLVPGRANDSMFLPEAVDGAGHAVIVLHKARKGNIFPGVVHGIGEAAQVENDVAHQVVIGVFAARERLDLGLQQVQEVRKAQVLVLPSRNGI
jgi:hypothetical protein